MKVHPHRIFNFKLFGLDTIVSDQPYRKFKVKPDSLNFMVFIAAVVITMVCSLLGILLVEVKFEVLTMASCFVLVPYLVMVFLEVFYPMPDAVIQQVTRDVKYSERRDNLEPTSDGWIFLYYFVLRNHPLLSKWRLLGKLSIMTLLFLVPAFVIGSVGYALFSSFVMILYCIIKVVLHSESQ